jgi:hypothetical protein
MVRKMNLTVIKRHKAKVVRDNRIFFVASDSDLLLLNGSARSARFASALLFSVSFVCNQDIIGLNSIKKRFDVHDTTRKGAISAAAMKDLSRFFSKPIENAAQWEPPYLFHEVALSLMSKLDGIGQVRKFFGLNTFLVLAQQIDRKMNDSFVPGKPERPC